MVGGREWRERRRVVGGRDVVDERKRVTERACSGGGASKTIFLCVCLLIHGSVGLIDEIILLCGGTERERT